MQVGQKIGPFDVEKKIGSGAMGAVYLARYRKTGQRVAIKMMLMGMADNDVSLARFEREAEVLKQLNHENIVRFYVVSQFQGTPYYAMEYVEGEPLDQSLQRKGRLTWEEVVELGEQVCAALQHAHDQGIVHRDLKPSNLMITPDGTLKLTDFGIAKDLDVTQLTSANCTVGTAAYMSPEQCRGERNLTHKSDLYSLGVVLFELLTGRKPFEAETTMDMFLQHVQGSFERPSRSVLDIPIWLDTLVCQLLEKEPARRPYDARTVSDSLSQVAEKVLAQRSAGVDVARARIVDRSTLRNASLDETDKQAARTLLTSLRKNKRKRRGKPLHEQKWLQAIGLMLALAGIGALIYQAFRPPSAEKLLGRFDNHKDSRDPEERSALRAGAVKDYLGYYGDLSDNQTTAVWEWARKYDVAEKERQFESRLSGESNARTEPERLAREAVKMEAAYNLAEAGNRWERIANDPKAAEQRWKEAQKTGADTGDNLWVLLAAKRLDVVRSAVSQEQDVNQTALAISQEDELARRPEPERIAIRAARYERLGDPYKARDEWNGLKAKSATSADQRSWYLLASKQFARLDKDLEGKNSENRKTESLKHLMEVVDADEKILKTNPPDPRKVLLELEEIVSLYRNDPEATDIAVKAATLLQNFTPQERQPANDRTGQGPS